MAKNRSKKGKLSKRVEKCSKDRIKSQKIRKKLKKYFWSKKMSHFFWRPQIGQKLFKKRKIIKKGRKMFKKSHKIRKYEKKN